ncbi:MAG: hypothetical protein HC794_05050, partial [Nitrospiraceae bacterium]|nr:hypothetical protein [Nitrospiraceae bacterium]
MREQLDSARPGSAQHQLGCARLAALVLDRLDLRGLLKVAALQLLVELAHLVVGLLKVLLSLAHLVDEVRVVEHQRREVAEELQRDDVGLREQPA